MSAGIIHGDIKPLNALVFDGDGKRIVKLADFGDASICDNEQSLALLPKSVPWDPPEHHYRGIPYQEAKKMDIYSFGYGTARNLEQSYKWLELSGKTKEDLERQVEYARILVVPPYNNERLRELQSQFLYAVNHASEYRAAPGESISEIKAALANEVRDIGASFGDTHNMTVELERILAQTLNQYGLSEEAAPLQEDLIKRLKSRGDTDVAMKVLADLCYTYSLQDRLQLAEHHREEVAEYYTQHLGQKHMGTLGILTNLAHTQTELGHLARAEVTLTRVIAVATRVAGIEHWQTLAANSILAAVYLKQGRLTPAENLQSQVLEARVRVLGENHESTWSSMANLAVIRWAQGRYKEAEDMEIKVVALRTKLLGISHPDTLTSMYNLARSYGKNQGPETEEEMLRKVLDGRKAVLSPNHGDTITTAASLARSLQLQNKLEEAEILEAEVVQKRIEKFGRAHPSVLVSRTDLMWILHDLGKYKQAEEEQLDNITAGANEGGTKDQNVLRCMSALASMYKVRGRLQESIALYHRVLQARIDVMGKTHRDTSKTAQDIEVVTGLIQRQKEHAISRE
ncbi:MAG: hypothetical protein L6R38_008457 [Xanthoria sp. 2 TBL-2021]|nr:MAG: hypothetical protein L6R38_008457 [Xanthoria sp. 2 TBL-2021]